jgi:hypothetical protein
MLDLFRRSVVIELFVLGALAFAALIVIGTLVSVFSLVGWFLWLPFKIIGWLFKGMAMLIALPFLLLAAVLGGFGLLLSVGVLFIPLLLPFAMIGAFIWWLFRRRTAPAAARSS